MAELSEDNADDTLLDLSCSSSSFEESEGEYSDDEEDNLLGLQPYQFEPVAVARDGNVAVPEANDRLQMDVNEWCTCDNCIKMATGRECKCCQEVEEVHNKVESLQQESETKCITEHPGFASVCLDVYVLETAYYQYRQRYGRLEEQELHMRYRYIAYRQLVRWCWGYLGKSHRVVLPSCAVTKIRETFPSAEYAGFKYPDLD